MRTARRSAAALLALGLLGGLAGTSAASAATAAAPSQQPAQSWIVRAAPGQLAAVTAAVGDLGGTVTRELGIIDAVAVEAPAPVAARLRADDRVTAVTANARVELQGKTTASTTTSTTTTTTTTTTGYDPTTDPGSLYTVTNVTAARKVWQRTTTSPGWTGKGIDVAVIDSGVTPVPGLDAAGKVVHGPDLSFESQSASTRNLDTFGHGTHMAGIIAGHDAGVDATALKAGSTAFLGMAPDARIVSVKVADAYGATDVTQVIAAIDWVVQHKSDPGFNIRVLNLSFGTPSLQPYVFDPLAHAAEVAWRKGLVVVVSAGNDATTTGKLLNPAQDPYVLAVAGSDSRGTVGVADDVVAPFSTRGDGVRNPDVIAPGTSVQSLRVPGSWVDVQHPGSALAERYSRGSGTSQSAAVVSGAAAVLLQQRPTLTPDQVKAVLMDSASQLPAADVQAQGRGLVKLDAAVALRTPTALQAHTRSTGTGSVDAARGGYRLSLEDSVLYGERDVMGQTFDSGAHAALAESGTAWTGGDWNGTVWTGKAWATGGWESAAWTGSAWNGKAWAGSTWASGSWLGKAWAGQSWADPYSTTLGTLNGKAWAGKAWAGGGWK